MFLAWRMCPSNHIYIYILHVRVVSDYMNVTENVFVAWSSIALVAERSIVPAVSFTCCLSALLYPFTTNRYESHIYLLSVYITYNRAFRQSRGKSPTCIVDAHVCHGRVDCLGNASRRLRRWVLFYPSHWLTDCMYAFHSNVEIGTIKYVSLAVKDRVTRISRNTHALQEWNTLPIKIPGHKRSPLVDRVDRLFIEKIMALYRTYN